MLKHLFLSFVIAVCLSANAAEPDGASQAQERWLKAQQDRFKNQQAPYRVSKDVFLQKQSAAPDPGTVQADQGKCFPVTSISFDGAEHLSDDERRQLASGYVDKCLDMSDIQALIRDTTSLYLNKGLITSRAYIKPQNLADKSLVVTVVEGRVESLNAVADSLSPLQLWMAFPTEAGDVLNLRDLEQGLEQVNRLSENQATMELIPGEKNGASGIVIKNTQSASLRGGVGLTNKGSDRFNILQVDGNLSADNLLGLNDNFLISASTEAGHQDLYSKTHSYGLSGSLPLGYWLFSFNSSYFDYKQTVRGDVLDFMTHGTATVNTFSIDDMVYRGQQDKLKVSASLTRKQTKNYIENVFLETSSRVIYIFSLGSTYTRYLNDGSMISGSLKWDRSMPWWGATTKVVDAEDAYQFDKFSLNLNYQNKIDSTFGSLDYRLNALYLYSPDVIIASEGVSIGGRYDVRGFNGNSLFGYQGGYISNELGRSFSFENDYVQYARLYGALDSGAVKIDDDIHSGYKGLVGASVGLDLSGNGLSLSLIYSQGLYKPSFFSVGEHEFYASLRMNF